MTHKTCTKCNKTRTLEAFGKFKTSPDGLNYRCKVCVRQIQRDRYKLLKRLDAKCFRCKEPFMTNGLVKYCSKQCRYEAQADRMTARRELGLDTHPIKFGPTWS